LHVQLHDLESYLMSAFQTERKILNTQQLRGGAQKVVYRISCNDGFTCILYVWDPSENFVLDSSHEPGSPSDFIGASYGSELFEYNHQYLQQLGVRTPDVFYIDRTKSHYPFDFAIVEDVGNVDIWHYIQSCPDKKPDVLERLNAMLQKMHDHRCDRYGQLNQVRQLQHQSDTCEHGILNWTLHDLEHLAQHVTTIKENKDRLTEVLFTLYDKVQPRREYGLIHSELGPDHVMIDGQGEPVLIDIEGAKFFDIEYEHSFLAFRFAEHYEHLRNDRLDPNRLRFYRFHLHISYASGPIEIIERGFPDADSMRRIMDSNVEATLCFLE